MVQLNKTIKYGLVAALAAAGFAGSMANAQETSKVEAQWKAGLSIGTDQVAPDFSNAEEGTYVMPSIGVKYGDFSALGKLGFNQEDGLERGLVVLGYDLGDGYFVGSDLITQFDVEGNGITDGGIAAVYAGKNFKLTDDVGLTSVLGVGDGGDLFTDNYISGTLENVVGEADLTLGVGGGLYNDTEYARFGANLDIPLAEDTGLSLKVTDYIDSSDGFDPALTAEVTKRF